jgi:hypothetical protein
MNAILFTAALALGQTSPTPVVPTSTALDGVWTVVAAEVNGRPENLSGSNRSIAIKNNTLTLPGVAALHGTVQLELGRNGTLRAIPAAIGTGNRRDPARPETTTDPGAPVSVVAGASGVYVRTADYLVLTIGDPSTATATGTGVGAATDARPVTNADATLPPAGPTTSIGQPPVSLVLRRATGTDAAPATAAPTPPALTTAPAMQRVSSIIGSNVTLSDGSTAGRIDDMVYGSNGTLDYAVLGNNGMFTAVPWGGLSWDTANRVAMLPLTRDQFGTIPTFGANAWSTLLADAAFGQRLQTSLNNFQDANGRPLFNRPGTNVMNRTGNPKQATNQNQPGNQSGTTTSNRPVTPGPARPGTQPNNQPPNQTTSPNTNRPNTPPANQQPGQPAAQPNTNRPGTQPGTKPPA